MEITVATVEWLQALYPSGIPLRIIQSERIPRVVFLGAQSEEVRELQQSIISKGLKISGDAVAIWDLARGDMPASFTRAPFCVYFGSSRELGSWSQEGDTSVLHTFSLQEIMHESSKKRIFWEHLKLLITRLHSHA